MCHMDLNMRLCRVSSLSTEYKWVFYIDGNANREKSLADAFRAKMYSRDTMI